MPYTHRGRIVYSRKTHKFTWCDVRRIARALGRPDEPKYLFCLYETLYHAISMVNAWTFEDAENCVAQIQGNLNFLANQLQEQYPFEDFGGGGFGGAGATTRLRDIFKLPFEILPEEDENGE